MRVTDFKGRPDRDIFRGSSVNSPGAAPASFIEAVGSHGWVRADGFWMGAARVTDSAGRDEELPATDLYAAQVATFSGAVAGAQWEGATLADGVHVSGLLGAACEFTRERAAVAS
jgi:hypothetical protein